MALIDKVKPQPKPDYSLSKQELEFLLVLVKNSTFKGENLELLYNLVYKLQLQYTEK